MLLCGRSGTPTRSAAMDEPQPSGAASLTAEGQRELVVQEGEHVDLIGVDAHGVDEVLRQLDVEVFRTARRPWMTPDRT